MISYFYKQFLVFSASKFGKTIKFFLYLNMIQRFSFFFDKVISNYNRQNYKQILNFTSLFDKLISNYKSDSLIK